ncbi:MAG: hypothetical protein J4478_00275 [Candidatus Diapherotrites archaeon]|uniref:Uncharacterized protein n=1 Tax=Candidatus Iainarchaeum sp. TaxID=3101447 RepID=A0A7J4K0C3_9ARCH|nr:hypothetical protein [Candidatus Diapherotrites archaeon]HIH21597.1 hypothetical protein [Candidatus Diapherotrites archaeon]
MSGESFRELAAVGLPLKTRKNNKAKLYTWQAGRWVRADGMLVKDPEILRMLDRRLPKKYRPLSRHRLIP